MTTKNIIDEIELMRKEKQRDEKPAASINKADIIDA